MLIFPNKHEDKYACGDVLKIGRYIYFLIFLSCICFLIKYLMCFDKGDNLWYNSIFQTKHEPNIN